MEVAESNNDASVDTSKIREHLVDTAVKFLANPKVVDSPLAQKQKFLQRRGLTDEEIRIACEKSGSYDRHDHVKPDSLTQSYHVVPPRYFGQMQLSWFDRIREIVHNVAIFSIVAYVINKIYDNYIAPFLFGKNKKSIEEKIDDLEKGIKNSMTEIQCNLGEVRTEIDRLGSDSGVISQLKEFKSELATVKGLLLTRKQFPSVNTPVVPPSIPAWQMSSVQAENDNDQEENKEELLEIGSGSGSSEPEHGGGKTSESSLEIIYSAKDCDTESCHSKKSGKEESHKED